MALENIDQVSRQVLQMANPITGKDGRLMLDGVMLQAYISRAIVEAIYVADPFRDGENITGKYAPDAPPLSSVRVALETALPSTSRTARVAGREGTPGNDGIINKNAPMIPSVDELNIVLNQLNDQMILFPELAEKATYIPLFEAAKRISAYGKSVVEDRAASTLAEILSYNIYRALNDGDNLNTVADLSAQYAYSDLLNVLNTKLSDGDLVTGAHTFGTKGRAIFGRPGFINQVFTSKSGVILNGSDTAQRYLRDYSFDTALSDRDYYGDAYRGSAMQFDFYEISGYVWSLAEGYLGLPKGSFDNIYAIAVSKEANARAQSVDFGVKIVDATQTRGMLAQPLNCWGHEAIRKSQIIGTPTLTTASLAALGFSDTIRKNVAAPKEVFTAQNSNKILLPVYNQAGEIVGMIDQVNVPKPNGGVVTRGLTAVTLTVTGTAGAVVSNAVISVSIPDDSTTPVVPVTNNGDGTYTFNVNQGYSAKVTIAAQGYTTATLDITDTQTADKTFAVSKALVAA